jgi:hypothetical protein
MLLPLYPWLCEWTRERQKESAHHSIVRYLAVKSSSKCKRFSSPRSFQVNRCCMRCTMDRYNAKGFTITFFPGHSRSVVLRTSIRQMASCKDYRSLEDPRYVMHSMDSRHNMEKRRMDRRRRLLCHCSERAYGKKHIGHDFPATVSAMNRIKQLWYTSMK